MPVALLVGPLSEWVEANGPADGLPKEWSWLPRRNRATYEVLLKRRLRDDPQTLVRLMALSGGMPELPTRRSSSLHDAIRLNDPDAVVEFGTCRSSTCQHQPEALRASEFVARLEAARPTGRGGGFEIRI
jgi:hypothetical protein